MTRQVDLATDYGVVYGSLGTPPYTLAEYNQAEANRVAIQQAIDDAFADGITHLEFKKAVITLGYMYYNNSPFAENFGEKMIYLKSNTIYDFGQMEIEIMFDSAVKSPYHTSTQRPNAYQLTGRVFYIENARNTVLSNLNLKGEVYLRAFTNTNEKYEEQSTGVYIGSNVFDFEIKNCNIHGFMGDSVSGSFGANNLLDGNFRDFEKGLYNTTTKVLDTTVKGAYVTAVKTLNANRFNANNFHPNMGQVRITAGSNKVLRLPSEQSRLIWLDNAENYLGESWVYSAEHVYIPYNATKVRFQIYNVISEDPTYTYLVSSYPPTLTSVYTRGLKLYNCTFSNNHRGGVSNLPDDFLIENCTFFHNGMDSGRGAPLFPDTTRYQIDIENVFSSGCVIKNNRFISSFNGALISSYNAVIENNIFDNSGGIGLYGRCLDAVVRGNKLYNGSVKINTFNNDRTTSAYRRKYVIESNFIYSTMALELEGYDDTDVVFKNNHIKVSKISISASDKCDFIVSDNIFTLQINNIKAGATTTTDGSLLRNLKNFNNNLIELDNYGTETLIKLRLYIQGDVLGQGNVLKNCQIYRTGYTYGDLTNRHIKGFTFDKCIFQDATFNTATVLTQYTDCRFVNTQLRMTLNDATVFYNEERFDKCEFNYTDESVSNIIFAGVILQNVAGKDRALILNDCKVISTQVAELTLLGNSSPTANYPRKVFFKLNNVETVGVTNLESRIFHTYPELTTV